MYWFPSKAAKRRLGSVAVLTGVSMVPILFFTAIAIDATTTMSDRRHAQNCCDAAALAGCITLSNLQSQGSTPTQAAIQAAVYQAASQNNFTNGTNCTITVNWPPTSGSFQNTNSVRVQITFPRSNLVVRGTNNVTVTSVSSCTTSAVPTFPILITDSVGAKAFWVNSGKLTLSTATVQVNSNSSSAATVEGMASSAANANLHVVGGSSGTFSPAVTTGVSPLNDPLALVPVPTTSGLTTYNQSTYTPDNSGNVTINPGYYPNGLYISSGNVTMNPGLYYIEGGNCWINTPGTVTGNGVTIYHNGSNSSAKLATTYGLDVGICLCPTNGNYSFNAPTTGTYAGISLWQSPNYTGEAFYDFWGSGALNVGIQYFPSGTLRCWAKTGVINCNELIAKDFKLLGSHEIYGNTQNGGFSNLTWNATRAANRPGSGVFLAE